MKGFYFNQFTLQQVDIDTRVWFGTIPSEPVIVPRKMDVFLWDDVHVLFAVRALLNNGKGELRNLQPARPVAVNRLDDVVCYVVREPLLVRVGDGNDLASFVALRLSPHGVQIDRDLVDICLSRALRRALRARKGER